MTHILSLCYLVHSAVFILCKRREHISAMISGGAFSFTPGH